MDIITVSVLMCRLAFGSLGCSSDVSHDAMHVLCCVCTCHFKIPNQNVRTRELICKCLSFSFRHPPSLPGSPPPLFRHLFLSSSLSFLFTFLPFCFIFFSFFIVIAALVQFPQEPDLEVHPVLTLS